MTTTIPKILGQPHKYTICPSCRSLNSYNNDYCNTEYYDCKTELVETSTSEILVWVEKEQKFWEEEGYTEAEIDNLEYYV